MGKPDNSINFNNKLYEFLPQKIELQPLDPKEKLKGSSIFSYDKNNDGQLNTDELTSLINDVDSDKNKIITDDEIENYCDQNNLKKKDVKAFIINLFNQLTSISKRETVSNEAAIEGITWGNINKFKLHKTQFGENYTKFSTSINDKNAHSAIYDNQNDKFIGQNGDKTIEITGVKDFLQNKKTQPKLIITNPDGSKHEILINVYKMTSIPFAKKDGSASSNTLQEDNYMFAMTQLMDSIQDLPPDVLTDLTENVSSLSLSNLKDNYGGKATQAFQNGTYTEMIILDNIKGGSANILTHEIGHTVDRNPMGHVSLTPENKQLLNNFLEYIETTDELLPAGFEYAYALTKPEELYAEYYRYKHTGTAEGDGVKLFKHLDAIDDTKWEEVKALLDNIESTSRTQHIIYEQSPTLAINDMLEYNEAKDAITSEQIQNTPTEDFWYNFNTSENIELTEGILKKYPKLFDQYQNGEIKDKIEVLTIIRNHPDLKPILENCLD